MLGRLLREPLLHFFALGAVIFVVASLRAAPDERAEADHRIVVTAGDVQHIADGFARTWQRSPTADEIAGLVQEHVRDEVYYREALKLGLERDDTVVRRRMRQKMEFVVEDAVTGPPPSEAELQAHLDAHPERFRRDAETSFRQVYVDRDRRGPDAAAAAVRALLTTLAAAGPDADTTTAGDATMLPADVEAAADSDVARTFGDDFARALAAAPVGTWSGPIASGYGLHVVLVRARTAARMPALAEVRDTVARDRETETRKQMVEKAYATLRDRYEVVIESSPTEAVATR